MNKNIIIVNPPVPLLHYQNNWLPNYGIGVLVSFLGQHGYQVNVEDLHLKVGWMNRLRFFQPVKLGCFKDEKRIISYIAGANDEKLEKLFEKIIKIGNLMRYDIVGFSIISENGLKLSLCLARFLKKRGKTVIFGGAITQTAQDYSSIIEYPQVDYLIKGDGEIPMLALLDHLIKDKAIAAADVPGLISAGNTYKEAAVFPLDDKSVPAFSDEILFYYKKLGGGKLVLPYMISRGCPNRCTFCSFNSGKGFYHRKAETTAAELRYLKDKYNTPYFHFCDSNMCIEADYFSELLDEMIEKKLDIYWGGLAVPKIKSEEFFRKMYSAGFRHIYFGMESGSPAVVRRMNKGFVFEDVTEIIRMCHKSGINMIFSFIIGYIYETDEEFDQTIGFIRENIRYMSAIELQPFSLLKASPVFNAPARFGISIREGNYSIANELMRSVEYDELTGNIFEEKEKLTLKRYKKARNVAVRGMILRSLLSGKFLETVKRKITGIFYSYSFNWDVYFDERKK